MIVDINFDTKTTGHTMKLVVRRCRYDVRKYSVCITVINIWNSLPDEIQFSLLKYTQQTSMHQ